MVPLVSAVTTLQVTTGDGLVSLLWASTGETALALELPAEVALEVAAEMTAAAHRTLSGPTSADEDRS